jgi:hypothetical protein
MDPWPCAFLRVAQPIINESVRSYVTVSIKFISEIWLAAIAGMLQK